MEAFGESRADTFFKTDCMMRKIHKIFGACSRVIIGTALVSAFLISASTATAATVRPIDRIVAVIENHVVTEVELDNYIERAKSMMRAQGSSIPTDMRFFRQEVLQQLITRKLQLQEASKMGIVIDDVRLDQAMNSLAANKGMTLDAYLSAVGDDYSWIRKQVRSDIAINTLLRHEVLDRMHIKESEIREFLMDEVGDLRPEFRMAMVRFKMESAPEGTRKLLKILVAKLQRENIDTLFWLRQRTSALLRELEICRGCAKFQVLNWLHFEALPEAVRNSFGEIGPGITGRLLKTSDAFLFYQILEVQRAVSGGTRNKYKAQHILLKPNPVQSEALIKERMDAWKQGIRKGEQFSMLARKYSEDSLSAYKGGDLGWLDPEKLTPEFAERLVAAKPKTIVGPFETPYGWHLLRVLEVHEVKSDLEGAYQRASEVIREEKSQSEIQNWLAHLRDTRSVRIIGAK